MNTTQEFQDWPTPISNTKSLTIEAVCRYGGVKITTDSSNIQEAGERWSFTFRRAPAYRSIQETYRSDLWSKLDRVTIGRTFIVVNSDFLGEVNRLDPLFGMLIKCPQHYVIPSDDEVFEILSEHPPEIERIS